MFKKIMPLSMIVALRFFGLFIVLPVLSIYALEMDGGNTISSWVKGVGGLPPFTQRLYFQIPILGLYEVDKDRGEKRKTSFLGLGGYLSYFIWLGFQFISRHL